MAMVLWLGCGRSPSIYFSELHDLFPVQAHRSEYRAGYGVYPRTRALKRVQLTEHP